MSPSISRSSARAGSRPPLVPVLVAIALAAAAPPTGGCVVGGGDAGDDDLASLEAGLPDPGDTKADGQVDIGALRARLLALVEGFSATTGSRFYPTPEAALTQIERDLAAQGLGAPRRSLFVGYLGAIPIRGGFHHTEFLFAGAVDPATGAVARLHKRTVGDPFGAGVFDEHHGSDPMSSRMCMTWDDLEAAVRASYLRGIYGVNFVCHTVSMKVLAAIGVAPEHFEPLVSGWRLARWVFGPRLPSGLPEPVASWRATRACDVAAVRASGL